MGQSLQAVLIPDIRIRSTVLLDLVKEAIDEFRKHQPLAGTLRMSGANFRLPTMIA